LGIKPKSNILPAKKGLFKAEFNKILDASPSESVLEAILDQERTIVKWMKEMP
jgi:hypothetical protein